MDVTPLVREGQQIIQSYVGGRFKISGQIYDSAVIVQPEGTRPWAFDKDFSDIVESDFEGLLKQAASIDVVLFGTGAQQEFFSPALKRRLETQGLSVDVMDTGAACRTYNVLMAEGRRVVAALLPF